MTKGTLVNCELDCDITNFTICDFGDITPNLELPDAHKELEEKVTRILKMK